MSPLLDALVAASKVGFDAPKCAKCPRHAVNEFGDCAHWCKSCLPEGPLVCAHCEGTDLDASDPFGLIGRAMMWLWSQKRNVTDDEYPNISAAIRDAETGCGMRGLKLVDDYAVKRHDGTPTGLAIALLRLVARVGGAA